MCVLVVQLANLATRKKKKHKKRHKKMSSQFDVFNYERVKPAKCQLNQQQLFEVTNFLLINPFVTADDASILFTAKFGKLISTNDIFSIEEIVTI